MVKRGSDTITRQQAELSNQVARLTELLAQNKELNERLRDAAARTADLNERIFRRISAELHDGPVQDLGLALLQLDRVIAQSEQCQVVATREAMCNDGLEDVQRSVRHAIQEVRAISGGLGLPQLDAMTFPETLARVVYVHERRTGTKVNTQFNCAPEQAPLSVKITVYRLIQEALSNAYRHAHGQGQQVQIDCAATELIVQIADAGPGFRNGNLTEWDNHLGLVGMRDRVESLGGKFNIESAPDTGTRVIARLSLREPEGMNER
ncbi:MAG: sensor histidine kinase [Chloroflexi bacterium]|nr:sensor histidine kinase [Chloroflexota bacterium]